MPDNLLHVVCFPRVDSVEDNDDAGRPKNDDGSGEGLECCGNTRGVGARQIGLREGVSIGDLVGLDCIDSPNSLSAVVSRTPWILIPKRVQPPIASIECLRISTPALRAFPLARIHQKVVVAALNSDVAG